MVAAAMERCAYCREHVPVTWRTIESASGALSARVAVCDDCRTAHGL